MVLPTYISIAEAAKRLRLDPKYLHRLTNNGEINAAQINGEIVVSEKDVIRMTPSPKDELPEYKRVKHLKGKPIWLSEAARKYEIGHIAILQQWMRKGWIQKLGMDGNKVLLDEADVAYCKAIYKKMGGSQGKRIFNEDGTPFTPRPSRRKPPDSVTV